MALELCQGPPSNWSCRDHHLLCRHLVGSKKLHL